MTQITALEDVAATPHASPFPDGEPNVVRLALDAGEGVAPHRHPERRIVCYLLSGRMRLELDDESHELVSGDVTRFDGDQDISPQAIEDSEALLVLARRADE